MPKNTCAHVLATGEIVKLLHTLDTRKEDEKVTDEKKTMHGLKTLMALTFSVKVY